MLNNFSITQLSIGLIALSIGALTAALISEYVFMLAPCKLCLYQRYVYVVLAIISAVALCFKSVTVKSFLLFCSAIVVLIGCITAFYHVGVEQRFFNEPASCSSPVNESLTLTLEEMKNQIYNNAPHCSEVSFTFLGISMAGWNGLMSLAIFIILVRYLNLLRRKT